LTTIKEIRRFNVDGNQRFIQLLADKPQNISELAEDLAFDENLTISSNLNTQFGVPKTRLELGRELYKYLGSGQVLESFSRDPLLWNWIAAALLPHLLGDPANLSLIGAMDRWILSPRSFRYYRHLCAGAFFAFEAHAAAPERAMALLCQDITSPGEIVGQIQATEDLAYSVGAEVATKLYYDAATQTIKPKAGGKGPGSARRLAASYLNQIRVTVDFKGMSADEILDILPSEFDHFKLARTGVNSYVPDEETDYDFESLRAQLLE